MEWEREKIEYRKSGENRNDVEGGKSGKENVVENVVEESLVEKVEEESVVEKVEEESAVEKVVEESLVEKVE